MKAIYNFCCCVCLSVSLIVLIVIWKPLYFHLRRLTKDDAVCWHGNDNLWAASRRVCRRWGRILSMPFTNRPKYLEFCSMFATYSDMLWLAITAIVNVITVNTFFFVLFFYLFACLTCFVIIGSNEPVPCPKFYCRTGVYPLSALEQHALRFAVIDYNIHIWGQDRVKVHLAAFVEWNTIRVIS